MRKAVLAFVAALSVATGAFSGEILQNEVLRKRAAAEVEYLKKHSLLDSAKRHMGQAKPYLSEGQFADGRQVADAAETYISFQAVLDLVDQRMGCPGVDKGSLEALRKARDEGRASQGRLLTRIQGAFQETKQKDALAMIDHDVAAYRELFRKGGYDVCKP